ncbi:MAG: ABC transporter ATP-binding protein [Ignavibacteria bacterium]
MGSINLICDNISKSYSGKLIFKDLSFKLSAHQSLLITGRNGSGKSTLIKIIANVIRPTNGALTIQENDSGIPDDNRFKKTGLLTPYLNLYDELTAAENLKFFFSLKSNSTKDGVEKIYFLLNRAGLYEKRNELVRNYSSGMKQKLKLLFAVMNNPGILLLDEPRTNLDKAGIDLVYEMSEEQKTHGILIVATNDDSDKSLCENSLNIEDYI